MSVFEHLVKSTQRDFEQHILRSSLLRKVNIGEATVPEYAAYLSQLFHFVRHTSRVLALAGSHIGDDQRALRKWFLEQSVDEHSHELLCLSDLEVLGYRKGFIDRIEPGPGAWSLLTQNYYLASFGGQTGLLGVASATEGLGSAMAEGIAQLLISRCGMPANSVGFLKAHAGFDKRHFEEVQQALEFIAGNETAIQSIVYARRKTFEYYGRLLLDSEDLGRSELFGLTARAA